MLNDLLLKIGAALVLPLGFVWTATPPPQQPQNFGAPSLTYHRTLAPETTSNFDLGTASLVWEDAWIENLNVTTCTGCGGSGSGNVSTSSAETSGQLPYWTSTNGTPATLGKVATTSLTINAPLTTSGTAGALVGGTALTIDIDDIKAADLDLSDITLNDFTNDPGFISDITGESIEDLSDVASFTQVSGDFLFYNGSAWDRIASSSLRFASSTLLADRNTWTSLNSFANSTSTLGTITTGWATNWNATFASSTALTVTGQVDFDSLTSALILTGAGGILAEYAGAGCTNQVVEDIDALGATTCVSIESRGFR